VSRVKGRCLRCEVPYVKWVVAPSTSSQRSLDVILSECGVAGGWNTKCYERRDKSKKAKEPDAAIEADVPADGTPKKKRSKQKKIVADATNNDELRLLDLFRMGRRRRGSSGALESLLY
jgi:hypothetical protein